ncbi:hypothetical protein [Flavobacterium sp. T12S277]|uniref:hypothetical protein n=1 Tax=Flavobacterium sp. T12S277 TaxID=3402752 RepID=UPI003ADE8801
MAKKIKVLIITDSLGFPRSTPELLLYEETYIALLRNKFADYDIIHQGRGGATIRELYNHSTYYHETLNPDIVIIQSGIVDCAPRALTLTEQHIISRLPFVSKILISLVKKNSNFLRRYRKIKYTPVEIYQEYIRKFNALFQNTYWIGILPASDDYEKQLHNIKKSIFTYNDILKKENTNDKYVSLVNYTDFDIMSDFHHLNKSGHAKLFKDISVFLSNGAKDIS